MNGKSTMLGLRPTFLRRCTRRWFSSKDSSRNDTGVLTDYHFTPMGESDLIPRSRVSLLSKEMLESKQMGIRGLSRMGFRMISGDFLYGPIAIFPKAVLSWRVLTPADINEQSIEFFTLLEPKLDVLVVGPGDQKNVDAVRRRITPVLIKHKIGLEIMNTEDAVATFNFLNAECRYVAAALYPPDDMVITDAEYGRALNLIKNWDELDENPLLVGIDSTLSRTRDVIKKLWDGRETRSIENMLNAEEREYIKKKADNKFIKDLPSASKQIKDK
uniref:NADH dehydrogenase [ubiquinone] 1 alpha subcomplex assembly factor 3 n=1 Tax=Parascaris univalens TaxID=6257 RepID=A0A915CGI0_PARUN